VFLSEWNLFSILRPQKDYTLPVPSRILSLHYATASTVTAIYSVAASSSCSPYNCCATSCSSFFVLRRGAAHMCYEFEFFCSSWSPSACCLPTDVTPYDLSAFSPLHGGDPFGGQKPREGEVG